MTAVTVAQLNGNPAQGRFRWLVFTAWVVTSGANLDIACALISASDDAPELAALAMPHLATAIGLANEPGAHTENPDDSYVTFSDGAVTLHLGDVVELRRVVHPLWRQAAIAEGWVRLVVSYVVIPPGAVAASVLRNAVFDGATATVPVRDHIDTTAPALCLGDAAGRASANRRLIDTARQPHRLAGGPRSRHESGWAC